MPAAFPARRDSRLYARLGAAACAVAAAGLLAACGGDDSAIPQAPGNDYLMDKNWQAIGIFTSPDAPSAIPDDAAEAPTITFGHNAAIGTTGCARFRAELTYDAPPEDAETLRINAIEFDEKSDTCDGEVAWAHSRMTQLLAQGHEFDITIDSNNQLVLTLRDGRVDSPSIRYVSF